MSPSAVLTSVLPRLCRPQRYHKVASFGGKCQKTDLLNSQGSRQYGNRSHILSISNSPMDLTHEPDRLFKHYINVQCLQKLLSSMIHTLQCKVDRYQCVHCDLGDIPEYVTPEQFSVVLNASLMEWKKTNKNGVWLQIPMSMGQVIPVAADYGFEYHHAEGDTAVLCLWLRTDIPSKLPPYATHQVGVSGVVMKDDKILVVRDRNRPFTLWKFPGGLSSLAEDIEDTAKREILEETGIRTEFLGILAFRQQHHHPNAFGRSDLFFICHMLPLTFEIVPSPDEIEACQWMKLSELESSRQTSAITQRIISLIRVGQKHGFDYVTLKSDMFHSVYKGLKFKIYNRWLPSDEGAQEKEYIHSVAGPEQLYNKEKK